MIIKNKILTVLALVVSTGISFGKSPMASARLLEHAEETRTPKTLLDIVKEAKRDRIDIDYAKRMVGGIVASAEGRTVDAADALIYVTQHLRPNHRVVCIPKQCSDVGRCSCQDKKVATSDYYVPAVLAIGRLEEMYHANSGDDALTEKIVNAVAETVVWDTSHEIYMAARGFLERLVSDGLLAQGSLDSVLEARRQNRISRGLPVIEQGAQCPLPTQSNPHPCDQW